MAASFEKVIATTVANYQDTLSDNVSTHNPTLRYMKSEGALKLDGGEKIVRPLMYALANGGSYSGLESLNTSNYEGLTDSQWEWAQNYSMFVLDGLSKAKNQGKSRVINLVDARMKQAELKMADLLATQLFANGTGNSGKDTLGLERLLDQDPTTLTVGGIDRSTYTWWRNYVNTSVGSFASGGVAAMSTAIRAMTRGNERPNLIVTNSTIMGYLKTAAFGKVLIQPAGKKMQEMNLDGIIFEGIDCIYDEKCPSDRMYFINTNALKYVIHKDHNAKMGELIEPSDKDGLFAKVLTYSQLTTDRMEACGVLSGFSA